MPSILFIIFGIVVSIKVKPAILGIIILIVPNVIIWLVYVFFNYQNRGYIMGKFATVMIYIALALIYVLTLVLALITKPIRWESCAYVLLYPELLIFAFGMCFSRRRFVVRDSLESEDKFNEFITEVTERKYDNWIIGKKYMAWYWYLIIVIASVLFNGIFLGIFARTADKAATFGTFGASILVDVALLFMMANFQNPGKMFFLILFAYVIKVVCVSFSVNYWFTSHGFIYLFLGTYFIVSTIIGIWQRKRMGQLAEENETQDIRERIGKLSPESYKGSFRQIFFSFLFWVVLTVALIIEIASMRKYKLQDLPFNVHQYDLTIILLVLSFLLALSITGVLLIFYNKGKMSWVSLLLSVIPYLAVLFFSIFWKDYTFDAKPFKILAFPIYFFVFNTFSLAFIFSMKGKFSTEGNKFANFFMCKLQLYEAIRVYLTILEVADIAALVVLPLIMLDQSMKFIGLNIVFALAAFSGYFAFIISFVRMKRKPWITFMTISIVSWCAFCGSIVPYTKWYFVLTVFFVVFNVFSTVFALVWSFFDRLKVGFQQTLIVSVPCIVNLVLSILMIINYDHDILYFVIAFLDAFLMFGIVLFHTLQKRQWFFTPVSVISLILLLACCIGVIVYMIIEIKSAFAIVTIICIILFLISMFSIIGYLSLNSSTSVIVFSTVFFPVRRLFSGQLNRLPMFNILFVIGFLSAYVWGIFASIFYDKNPSLGFLVSGAVILVFGLLVCGLIYNLDFNSVETLRFISPDVVKFAIDKAMQIMNIQPDQLEPPTGGTEEEDTIESFIEFKHLSEESNRMRSLFLSSLKAQFYVSGEVAFESALDELITYCDREEITCKMFETKVQWSSKKKFEIFEIVQLIHDTQRAEIEDGAQNEEFVRQQGENRQMQAYQQLQDQKTINFREFLDGVKKDKFNDKDFAPAKNIKESLAGLFTGANWQRLENLYHGKIVDKTDPFSIQQGLLGDCYFIAAMVSIAKNKEIVETLFSEPRNNEKYAACVTFNFMGKRTPVIVDTTVPVKSGKAIFAHPAEQETPLWFCLVEKAFAKYHGSYSSIVGGMSHVAFYRLIGGWPMIFYLKDLETKEMIRNGELWNKLLKWHRKGNFLCAGSNQGSDTQRTKNNIALGHAYTVLQVVECYGHKMIQLRNTWGRVEWTGPWSDKSFKWSAKMKKSLKPTGKEDGIFWMEFNDFVQNYYSVSIGIRLKSKWKTSSISGEWKSGRTDGAMPTTPKNNVESVKQWSIRFSRKTKIRLTLEKAGQPTVCYIYLANFKGRRVKVLYRGDTYKVHGIPQSNILDSWEWTIDDVSSPWTIFFCRKPQKKPTLFNLTIHHTVPITINELKKGADREEIISI